MCSSASRFVLTAVLLSPFLQNAVAQLPTVQRIHSSNFQAGKVATLTASGGALKNVLHLWTPLGNIPVKPSTGKPNEKVAQFEGAVPDAMVPGIYETRIVTAQGISAAQFLVVDDLPNHRLPDQSVINPPASQLPAKCSINDYVTALKPKYFGLSLKKDQVVSVEVYARRLDSPMDPVLRLIDPSGRELLFVDDTPGLSGDAQFRVIVPGDGNYVLEVRDVKYTGGANHFYHLRVGDFVLTQGVFPRRTVSGGEVQFVGNTAPEQSATISASMPIYGGAVSSASEYGSNFATVTTLPSAPLLEQEPNDTRETATVVEPSVAALAGQIQQAGDIDWYQLTVDAKQHLCVTTHTRDLGAPTDAILEIYDEAGKKLQESDDAGADDARLSLSLPAAGKYFLSVKELTGEGAPAWTYDLDVQYGGQVKVRTATDVVAIPKGGTVTIPVTIERCGFAGAFEIVASNLPPGIISAPVIVSEKQKTGMIALQATADTPDAFQHLLTIAAKTAEGALPTTVLYEAPVVKGKEGLKMQRLQSGVFGFAKSAPEFTLTAGTEPVTVAKAGAATAKITAVRNGDWKEEIVLTSAVPAAELPVGITLDAAKITEDAVEITVKASDKAKPGRYSLSLQGTLKKDKKTVVQPVPTISLEVTEPAPATEPVADAG